MATNERRHRKRHATIPDPTEADSGETDRHGDNDGDPQPEPHSPKTAATPTRTESESHWIVVGFSLRCPGHEPLFVNHTPLYLRGRIVEEVGGRCVAGHEGRSFDVPDRPEAVVCIEPSTIAGQRGLLWWAKGSGGDGGLTQRRVGHDTAWLGEAKTSVARNVPPSTPKARSLWSWSSAARE